MQHNKGNRSSTLGKSTRRLTEAAVCVACVLATFLGAPSKAAASYITLLGRSNLQVSTETTGGAHISGWYEFENRGNESAVRTFASFAVGSWTFVTPPTNLAPNEAKRFPIDEFVTVERLACAEGTSTRCAGENLPIVGTLPLFITRHYEDTNGYHFSAVELQTFSLGVLSSPQKSATAAPPTEIQLQTRQRNDSEYIAEVMARNLSDSPQALSLAILAPREFDLVTPAHVVRLSPRATATETFVIANRNGLIGSTYSIVAVGQGAAEAARYVVYAERPISLILSPRRAGFTVLWITVAVGFISSAYLLWTRRSSPRRAST